MGLKYNYHKAESISDSTLYEDAFVDNGHFIWYSKSKRKLSSPDVVAILGHQESGMRIPLFVKKSNDEGQDFYYMGELGALAAEPEQVLMPKGNVTAVKMTFALSHPVETDLYLYIRRRVRKKSALVRYCLV